MNDRTVTVFGGTGFLGHYVVRRLSRLGFVVRAASRHPRDAKAMFAGQGNVHPVLADARDPDAVAAALAGSFAVVNAVSLYVERGADTFDAIHVSAAGVMAHQARQAGVKRLVLVSGIGASTASPSLYVRKRGEGEAAVASVFPEAVIVRPAVMFGTDGGIVTTVLDLLRRLPVYPMFGRGQTRLQPVAVEDVAEAIARLVAGAEPAARLFEFGGPRVFTYEEFLRTMAREAGLRPVLAPFPFAGWHILARVAEMLPHPPVTRNQVELMEVDTVTSPGRPGLRELGIAPQPVEDTVRALARGGG
jgi:NADH dehydrogenase